MKKLIINRLLVGVFIMLAAALLSFTVLFFAPGNPAESILRQRTGDDPSYEQIDVFMENHGLSNDASTEITKWLYMAFRFDFGNSINTGEPVMREFFDRFNATAQLALVTILISTPIALIAGVWSAAKKNRFPDHLTRFFSLLGISIPDFWLGLALMILFSQILRWLPTFGYGSWKNFVLPVLTMVVGQSASLTRIVRTSMLDTLSQDYIVTAKGNGLKQKLILMRYALRNSLGPIVTALGSQLGHLLGGTVIVETVFGWPGIGKFLIDAINARDYPVIQGFVLIIALMYIIINLITDILYIYIDPRIRYEKE